MSLLYFAASSGVEQLILSGVTYPNNPGYQAQALMPYGLGNYQYSPLIWTVLDKTFISVTGDENPSHYYIYVYDHFRNMVSNAIDTGLLCSTAQDIHHLSSIIGTALDELFITETSFHGGGGDWKISKTAIDFDVNNFNAWTDTLVNESTYHHLQKFANGDIYNVVRKASIAGNYANSDLYKSTNNGTSFGLVHRILDWGASPDANRYIPYHALIYSGDDVLRLWVNSLNYTYSPSVFIGGPITYYLESIDGGTTWRNVDNSFSKDVIATSPLTLAEMNTNMIAYDLATATDIIRANGGCLVDSKPYMVGGSGDVANSPLALYYWSGSAWVQNVITCAGHTILPAYSNGIGEWNNAIGLYQNGSNIDLICTETVSAKAQLSRFRTSDNGTTWTFIEQFTSNSANHRNGHINKNLDDAQFKVAACVVDNGDTSDRLYVKSI